MEDLEWFNIAGESPTASQRAFLAALREEMGDTLQPHCPELSPEGLLLILDVDAPGQALVSMGIMLEGRTLRGDRTSIHDYGFPRVPSEVSLVAEGDPGELAAAAHNFFARAVARPVVRHEWVHRGRVFAACYLFEDTGERLSQSYRSDWAPAGQEAKLIADGFVHGKGWVQTEGLGKPSRVVRVRGEQSEAAGRTGWRRVRSARRPSGLRLWYQPYPGGGPQW